MLKFRTHGKWILAGEHSVLRGGKALVFPVQSRHLDFSFIAGDELRLIIEHEDSDLQEAFWAVFERALQILQLQPNQVVGTFSLSSNIPVGAGMGASATLCVSLAKFFTALGHLSKDKQYEFAKDLEDMFHGQSSGVDVAVTLNNQGLEFQKPNQKDVFEPKWQPSFYLSYCGQRGVTADCIERVQRLIDDNPKWGAEIDSQMQKAVGMAHEALQSEDSLDLLKESIDLACDCFDSWGLISQNLEDHMSFLKEHGALACKPTGSGGGGFVLSLWQNPPDSSLNLIQA